MRRDGVNLLAIAADVVEQLDYLGRLVFVVVVVVSELRVLLVRVVVFDTLPQGSLSINQRRRQTPDPKRESSGQFATLLPLSL